MNAANSIIFGSAQYHHHDISHIYWDYELNSSLNTIQHDFDGNDDFFNQSTLDFAHNDII